MAEYNPNQMLAGSDAATERRVEGKREDAEQVYNEASGAAQQVDPQSAIGQLRAMKPQGQPQQAPPQQPRQPSQSGAYDPQASINRLRSMSEAQKGSVRSVRVSPDPGAAPLKGLPVQPQQPQPEPQPDEVVTNNPQGGGKKAWVEVNEGGWSGVETNQGVVSPEEFMAQERGTLSTAKREGHTLTSQATDGSTIVRHFDKGNAVRTYSDGDTYYYHMDENGNLDKHSYRRVSPSGTIYEYDSNGNTTKTTPRSDYELTFTSFSDHFGGSYRGIGNVPRKVYGMLGVSSGLAAKLADGYQGGGDFSGYSDSELRQAIAKANSGTLGATDEENTALAGSVVKEAERRYMGFSSVKDMYNDIGRHDLITFGEALLNRGYKGQYAGLLRSAVDAAKRGGDLSWLRSDIGNTYNGLWNKDIQKQLDAAAKEGKNLEESTNFTRYFNKAVNKDDYLAWACLKSGSGGLGLDRALAGGMTGHYDYWEGELDKALNEEAKKMANSPMYYLQGIGHGTVSGNIGKWIGTKLFGKDYSLDEELYGRSQRYVSNTKQMFGSGLTMAASFGEFYGAGKLAGVTTKAMLGADAMEYAMGRVVSQGLTMGYYNMAVLGSSDLAHGHFSGFPSYLSTFLEGTGTGIAIGWVGSKTAPGIWKPTTLLRRSGNELYRFFAEGGTFGLISLFEKGANGELHDWGDIAETLYHSYGSLLVMKASTGGVNLKAVGAKPDSVAAIERLGYNDLAEAVKENNERIRHGESPLKLTGTAAEQYRQLCGEMEKGGRVSWAELSDISQVFGMGVVPPRASRVVTVARGGKYYVQALDLMGNVIKETKGLSESKAASKEREFQRCIDETSERLNCADFNFARATNIARRAAESIVDLVGNGEPAFLEDGSPNPKYKTVTPDDIYNFYNEAKSKKYEDRTERERRVVEAFESKAKELDESTVSMESIIQGVLETYGVSEREFYDELNRQPGKRKKNTPASQAVAAFNSAMSMGFESLKGERTGEVRLKDGRTVEIVNKVDVDENGAPRNPREFVVFKAEDGSRHMVSVEDVQAISYDAPSETDRALDLSLKNSERDKEQARQLAEATYEGLSTEELIDEWEKLIKAISSKEAEGTLDKDLYSDMLLILEDVMGKKGIKLSQDNKVVKVEPAEAAEKAESTEKAKTAREKAEIVVYNKESFGGEMTDAEREELIKYYIEHPLELEEEIKAVEEREYGSNEEGGEIPLEETQASVVPEGVNVEPKAPISESVEVSSQAPVEQATGEVGGTEVKKPAEDEVKASTEDTQSTETDPLQRQKAEAFVDAYFPELKDNPEAREQMIQNEIARGDFENTVRFDKEDGVNKAKTDAYDAAVSAHEEGERRRVEEEETKRREEEAKRQEEERQRQEEESRRKAEEEAAKRREEEEKRKAEDERQNAEAERDRKIEEIIEARAKDAPEEYKEQIRELYRNDEKALEEDYRKIIGEKKEPAREEPRKEEPPKQEPPKEEPPREERPKEEERRPEDPERTEPIDDLDTPVPVVKTKGGEEELDFSATTPRRGYHYIYNESGLPKEVADQTVANGIASADNAIKAHAKKEPQAPKKPSQIPSYNKKHAEWEQEGERLAAEKSYWEEVQRHADITNDINEIDEARGFNSRRDVFDRLRRKYGNDPDISGYLNGPYVPQTLYDACMDLLARGTRFIWEGDRKGIKVGLSQHAGLRGEEERRRIIGMLASEENGGITPEKAVHRIVDEYGQGLHIGLDESHEILNTLIDAIKTAGTRGGAADYIREKRLADVRDALVRRRDGEGRSSYDEISDRRAEEELQEFREDNPEYANASDEEVADALIEKSRRENPAPVEPASDESPLTPPSGDVPFQAGETAAPAKAVSRQARRFTARVLNKLRKAGVRVKVATQEEAQRMRELYARMGAEFQAVFHGSANDFDAFDHSHMGEGEGAQAYGYGTYVTGVEGIAKHYATQSAMNKRFSKTPGYGNYDHYWKGQKIDLSTINPLRMAYDIVQREGTIKKAIAQVEKFIDNPEAHEGWGEALEILRQSRKSDFTRKRANYEGERFLYEVEIPDNDGTNYLEWVENVSSEQGGRVAEAFGRLKGVSKEVYWPYYWNISGEELYRRLIIKLGSDRQASELLREAGFVGIEYPAQYRSGGRSDGAKNYVIFNEADAKITNKTEFLVTKDGKVYGWHDSEGIHLTEDGFNPDTPAHEYTHGFMRMLKENDPKTYRRVVEGLKQSEVWEEVLSDPAYENIRGDEDAVASEVAARLSGRENASRVNTEFDFSKGNIFSAANAVALGARVKNALRDLWDRVQIWFGGRKDELIPADQAARMVLRALDKGVNPDAVAEDTPEFSVVQGEGETTTDNSEPMNEPRGSQYTDNNLAGESRSRNEGSSPRDFDAELRDLYRRGLFEGYDSVKDDIARVRAEKEAALNSGEGSGESGETPSAAPDAGGEGSGERPSATPPAAEPRAGGGGEPPEPPREEPPVVDTTPEPEPQPRPELPATDYDRPLTMIEKAQSAAMKVIADTKASLEQRNAARGELGRTLRDIHKAMRLQKEYDRSTVENVVSLCKMMVQEGLIDRSYLGDIKKLFTRIKDANGKQDLTSTVNGIVDIMLQSQERSTRNELSRLLKEKGMKVGTNGVVKQAGLDIRGQHTMQEFSEYLGKGSVIIDRRLNQLEEMRSKVGDDDIEKLNDIDDKITGCLLAKQFSQIEETNGVNIRESVEELAGLKEQYKNGEIGVKEYTERKHAQENLIRSYRMSQIDDLWNTLKAVNWIINGSREGAKDWISQQKERQSEIRHNAYSDMEGTSKRTQGDPTIGQKVLNMGIPRFLSSSLYTLQTMLKSLGDKHALGEGYLYNRFFRGWMEQRDAEITEYRNDMDTLNAKAKELTGRTYFGIYNMIQKLPKMTVEYMDGGEMVPHELDQGQLGYAYMVNKMEDGAAALRGMGISEEKMQEIANFLDPSLKEFYDWLQDDFLAGKWEGMNEVHKRMFGADMDRVENYIPLHRDREAGKQEVDLSQNGEPPLQSTVVGSIIQRVHSNLGIDLKHNNAIEVVARHLLEATHWKHFSEWKRDANTLLSDTTFRNKVKNSTTIYGSGDILWNRLNQVFQIAGGDYKPKGYSAGVDGALVNLAKTVNTAKVSMRVFTAVKQLLSLPAFASECNTATLLKNVAFLLSPVPGKSAAQNSFVWCMENLPQFRERVVSRTSGETRLENGDLGWGYSRRKVIENAARIGLAPNAFIDACTIAAGAKSIYEKRFAQYKKDGYSEEVADKKAKIDAEIAFNESQQSSEKAFVAPIQVDRTAAALGLSTFRNASMGFERKFIDAVRNFKHLTMGGKEYKGVLIKRRENELVAQGMAREEARASAEKEYKHMLGAKAYREVTMEFMQKQMVRDGLTETQAKNAAERLYRRALWRSTLNFLMFGFGAQMAWNVGGKLPYLIFGDDDEQKEKMVKQAAIHAAVGGWIEGLPAGDMLSEGMTNWAMNLTDNGDPFDGASFFEFDPDLLTVTSDIVKVTKAIEGNNPLKGATDFMNLMGQIFTGVNPQTFTDAGVAIYDACNGDVKVGNEALMCVLRIMQCPQSQLDQMYIDELKMSAREARGLSPEEVARRYAYYKAHKDAPYMWWMYNQGKQDKIVKKYEGDFTKKLNKDVKEAGATPEDYRDLMRSSTTTGEHQKNQTKYINALSERGPEALRKAWETEADQRVKEAIMERYIKDTGEQEVKDNSSPYRAMRAEEATEKTHIVGNLLGFDAELQYKLLSSNVTAGNAGHNKTVKAFREIGGDGVQCMYRTRGKNARDLSIEEGGWTWPQKDAAKAAKCKKFYDEHKEELERIYRSNWRNNKINKLLKDTQDNPANKERNNQMILEILQAEEKDK